MPLWYCVFKFVTFFSVILSEYSFMSYLESFSSPFYFLMLIFHSVILLYSFCSLILPPNCLFPLHPVVSLSCILHALFRYFIWSCFVYIAWPFPGIFWVSQLLSISFHLFLPVVFSVWFVVFRSFPFIVSLCILPSLVLSRALAIFFICTFLPHFSSKFCLSLSVPWKGCEFYRLHKVDHLVQWCFMLRYFLLIYLTFRFPP